MISIKKSFADCFSCDLFNAPSCIYESNSDNFEDIEIVFVAENPGKTEVENNPPKPLIGRAGQIFRKYFNFYGINERKYLLTNVVWCLTLDKDGKTGNPNQKTIDKCKVNCFELIKRCDPKLIVLMGNSPLKAFNIVSDKEKITSVRGNVYKWNNIDVLVTVHPSYILHNRNKEEDFSNDIKKAGELIGLKFDSLNKSMNKKLENINKGIFYYKIPDKFYKEDYKLIDVQMLRTNEVLYIFRDKDNKKVYHKENDNYICYQCKENDNAELIKPYDELKQIKIPYREKSKLDNNITYEGDVKLAVKHAQDFYHLRKDIQEPKIPLNILFHDIETYTSTKENSSPEDANDIICMITYYLNGNYKTLAIDPKELKIDKKITIPNVTICKNERELLNTFIKDFRDLEPDFVTGWFSNGFDLPYIINRCKKLSINYERMSKFSEVDIDIVNKRIHISGCVAIDMLELYRSFTFGNKESYSLDYIAHLELGEGKLGKGYNFSEMFRDNPDEAIKYNIQDVVILVKLDSKLKHIAFQNEIRKICKTNFDSSKYPLGQIDSIILAHLKEKNLAAKNAKINREKQQFTGAYVQEPIKGLHEYIVDLDATALYPSTIITYNLGVNTFVMKLKNYRDGFNFLYNPDKISDELEVVIDPCFLNKTITVNKKDLYEKIEKENLIKTVTGCFFKQHENKLSFYSEILINILDSRKHYKNLMFEAKKDGNEELRALYDSRQNVMKIIANSLYGAMSNVSFRFFDLDIARSITLSGQELLKTCLINTDTYVENKLKNKNDECIPLQEDEMFSENIQRKINHVITCDTDSLFIGFSKFLKNKDEENNIKKVTEMIDEIQEWINKKIITSLIEKHNVNLKYNRLDFKNEFVMRRGLFLAKKRYTTYVTLQEGVKCNEIVSKGIETRRSDFPSYTKEKLQELIDIILKQEFNLTKILKHTKEIEKDISIKIRNGNKEIARPVSYTKKIEDYKTIPMGVKAMENFNNLEYKVFGVGSRGYLFKIEGIDETKAPKEVMEKFYTLDLFGKLKEIAIPEVMNELPPYYIIDYKEMLRFVWLDRVKLLLEPILTIPDQQLMKF